MHFFDQDLVDHLTTGFRTVDQTSFEEGFTPTTVAHHPTQRTTCRGSDRPSQVAQPCGSPDSPRKPEKPPRQAERKDTESWAHGGIGSPIENGTYKQVQLWFRFCDGGIPL